ncbi:hypothetical protein NHX12_018430 [Muraenolepis orangiensis]|uniref:Uncharacterized protein n=1 Tax=Muraenolepis orangiensis TaxID=630683 RepID=A0A9Q0IY05_9TELE|nr:hypothetical protein NHX12_018430 [Muraenolepis orangiensis]
MGPSVSPDSSLILQPEVSDEMDCKHTHPLSLDVFHWEYGRLDFTFSCDNPSTSGVANSPELDRAHRTLATKPRQGDKPRPVIVCFHRHQTKELVIREARKRRNDLTYQDSPIRIYEDYCPEVQEQRVAYRDIMAKLYSLGLRPALLYPAKLQIIDKEGGFPQPRKPSPT